MSDLPFTPEDEREWVADDIVDDEQPAAREAGDETDAIDARVLSEASEIDALDQRRPLVLDDERAPEQADEADADE